MEIEEMAVRDAYRIRPRIHSDERGAFFESFRDGSSPGHRPCVPAGAGPTLRQPPRGAARGCTG
ncbi:dTDP-4-dehydrorhamnose 3,5-epimerase family protein [Streptomyces tricolor]|nr:dTDP-4-dehydrorhamnose 3,5-epimerase family protein [Streptomyces tricolor]